MKKLKVKKSKNLFIASEAKLTTSELKNIKGGSEVIGVEDQLMV